MERLIAWIPTAILVGVGIAIFAGREAIRAWITGSIQHNLDTKLETIRSDLRSKEETINALRQGALVGAIRRREALEKRRLEAIDKLWKSVISMASFELASRIMQTVNFEVAAKEAPYNANARKFFETLSQPFDLKKLSGSQAATERPYVSERAWALFSAYQTIVILAISQLKVLETGLEKAAELINKDHIRTLVESSLPHQLPFIDKQGPWACHFLVDELRETLLVELKDNLTDGKASEEDITAAARILKAVEQIQTDLTARMQ